jgi:hypothetical protein
MRNGIAGRRPTVRLEPCVWSNGMPDHRYMYPKVVPLLHNFAAPNVRIALQSSMAGAQVSKTASDFVKSDGGHYREASVQ